MNRSDISAAHKRIYEELSEIEHSLKNVYLEISNALTQAGEAEIINLSEAHFALPSILKARVKVIFTKLDKISYQPTHSNESDAIICLPPLISEHIKQSLITTNRILKSVNRPKLNIISNSKNSKISTFSDANISQRTIKSKIQKIKDLITATTI